MKLNQIETSFPGSRTAIPFGISPLYKKVHVKMYHVSWINQLEEIFESFVREMFYPPFFRESPFLPSLPYLSKEGGGWYYVI